MAFSDETFSTHQLFTARDHVWNQMLSYVNAMSLKCAIELGIFDIMYKHGKPITLEELVHALPINKQKSNGMDRLMRILIHSKFSVKVSISDKKVGYWLTPASRLLVKEDPLSITPLVSFIVDPFLIVPCHHLGEWFKNDTPTACVTANGKSIWELVEDDPSLHRFLDEAMDSDTRFVASVITRECKQVFEGLKSIVDVGGGTGIMAKALGDAFPGLKCTVLELPHVVARLEGTDNLVFVGGDMFASVPPANAVLFKWTLHGWTDEDCLIILKNCKEAINSDKENGGKLIVIDMVVGDDEMKEDKATETQFRFDVLMMTVQNGKERTEKQWKQLFLAAGFKSYKITPCLGSLRCLIEVFP